MEVHLRLLNPRACAEAKTGSFNGNPGAEGSPNVYPILFKENFPCFLLLIIRKILSYGSLPLYGLLRPRRLPRVMAPEGRITRGQTVKSTTN